MNNIPEKDLTAYVVAYIVTFGKENKQKYRTIIRGLLPEVLKQHKYRKNAIDFVLSRWDIASDDNEIKTISKLLKRAIIVAEKSWLIALLSGVFLVTTGSFAMTLLANNRPQTVTTINPGKRTTILAKPVVPDCVIEGNCTSLIKLVQLDDRYSPNFDKGELTVGFKDKSVPDDRLIIRNQGNNRGEVGINGKDVTYQGTVIGSFTGGKGINPLIVTFNTNATREAVEAVVSNITYQNVSENPEPGTRSIEVKITDGDGGITKTPLIVSIRIVAKSNIALTVPNVITAKENTTKAVNGISLSAPDNKEITVVLKVSNGIITVKNNVANGLTANNISSNKTRKVTLIGTVAQVKTTLADAAAITYRGKTDFTGEDSLIVTGNINHTEKGLVWPPNALNNQPISKRIGITLKTLNPPPIVIVPGNQITNENTPLSIGGINIKDPNNQAVTVTLEVYNGTLAIKTDVPDGLTADNIKNNNNQKVTLQSSITKINNTLADSDGVIYKSQQKYTGKDKLNVTANDSEKIEQRSIGIIVNDNPILRIPEFVTTSNGMTITKSDAANLVKSWLTDKKYAFASPYNYRILQRYTTGKYYRARKGAVDWLRKYRGNYTFGSPTVKPNGEFFVKENQVIIDVKVYQKQKLFVRGKIDPTRNSPSDGVYRYTLQLKNGSWKIADAEEINQ